MAARYNRIWQRVYSVLKTKDDNQDKLYDLLEIIFNEKFIDQEKDREMRRLQSKINRQRKIINEYESFIEYLKIHFVNFDEFEKDYKNFKRGDNNEN